MFVNYLISRVVNIMDTAYKYMYNHVQRQKLEMAICPLNLMFMSLHSNTTVTLVKQDILTSREHLCSPMILVRVRAAQPLVALSLLRFMVSDCSFVFFKHSTASVA